MRPSIEHSGSSFDAQSAAKLTKDAFIAKNEKTHYQGMTEANRRTRLGEVWQLCKDAVAEKTPSAPAVPEPPAPAPAKPADEKKKP